MATVGQVRFPNRRGDCREIRVSLTNYDGRSRVLVQTDDFSVDPMAHSNVFVAESEIADMATMFRFLGKPKVAELLDQAAERLST